jgi:cell division protein FtsL
MRHKLLPLLVLVAALSLAITAAYYSVFGISKLFSAQTTAVIIMAGILEASKVITAAYLERFWKTIHWIRKVYFVIAMIVLMGITSLGIYGFLVSAYQETSYKMQAVDKQVEVQIKKRDRYKQQVLDLTKEQQDINTQIIQLSESLGNNVVQYTNSEGQVITTQSSSTRKIIKQQLESQQARRDTLAIKQDILNDSVTAVDLRVLDLETNSDVAAEIGPLKYVASITNQPTDKVVNWFILLFIIVFDPLAIMLLISANKALAGDGNQEESKAKRVKAPTPEPSPPSAINEPPPSPPRRRNKKAQGSKWW